MSFLSTQPSQDEDPNARPRPQSSRNVVGNAQTSGVRSPESARHDQPRISTQNSKLFQRRQRRKLEKDDDQTRQVDSLRHARLEKVRRASESRTSSDSYSWIQRFMPEGTKPVFNIFNALLDQPELMLEMTKWLDVEDLISLYATSKDFHLMMNTQMTTMVLGNARSQAPESADVFRPQCYRSLCMFDPARNMNHIEGKTHTIRDVPGLRWLRMIAFREKVVDSIIKSLAGKGLRLPRYASKVLKKIWFLMDVSDTGRRIGIIHNPSLWSDVDLYIACMFFMKFDMVCNDPMDGNGELGIRRLLLAQRSLAIMDEVLKREAMRDSYELLQMHVEWKLNRAQMPPGMLAGRTVFGVAIEDCGRLSCQDWIPGLSKLLRPDEMVIMESIRRGLNFEDKLIDLMLWGNLHPATNKDVFPKDEAGEIQTTFDEEVEQLALKNLTIHASPEGTRIDWESTKPEDEERITAMLMGDMLSPDSGGESENEND